MKLTSKLKILALMLFFANIFYFTINDLPLAFVSASSTLFLLWSWITSDENLDAEGKNRSKAMFFSWAYLGLPYLRRWRTWLMLLAVSIMGFTSMFIIHDFSPADSLFGFVVTISIMCFPWVVNILETERICNFFGFPRGVNPYEPGIKNFYHGYLTLIAIFFSLLLISAIWQFAIWTPENNILVYLTVLGGWGLVLILFAIFGKNIKSYR